MSHNIFNRLFSSLPSHALEKNKSKKNFFHNLNALMLNFGLIGKIISKVNLEKEKGK